MSDSCVHLHNHSQKSLLDGAIRVEELPARAKELGMSAIAITDHGTLSGTLEFYQACKKQDIKPILGIETYITNDPNGIEKTNRTRDNYHMILLAKNNIGWKNLMYLSANAFKDNFYYKPRISIEQLQTYSEGLIASSACLAGICSRYATYDEINNTYSDPEHKAEYAIDMFKELFSGNYYLELMDNSQPQQIAYNTFLKYLGNKTKTKLIMSADAHYTNKEDEGLHTLLMAMQSKQNLEQYKQTGYFHYENCYLRSIEEMRMAAKKLGIPEALANTCQIASDCDVTIETGKFRMPVYNIKTDRDYQSYMNSK